MASTVKIKYDFAIGSLNARGLNNNIKRNSIFTWAKKNRFDILFLQECYCSQEIEKDWTNEWNGEILFSHGSKHGKGTMILFNNTLDYL